MSRRRRSSWSHHTRGTTCYNIRGRNIQFTMFSRQQRFVFMSRCNVPASQRLDMPYSPLQEIKVIKLNRSWNRVILTCLGYATALLSDMDEGHWTMAIECKGKTWEKERIQVCQLVVRKAKSLSACDDRQHTTLCNTLSSSPSGNWLGYQVVNNHQQCFASADIWFYNIRST